MCDLIKVYQFFYIVGNILYCDILLNNIIIMKFEVVDGFRGMLIDFDLVKERDSGFSGV